MHLHAASTADVEIRGTMRPGYESLLTPEAVEFVADLARRFRPRVDALLDRRREIQARFDAGARPGLLSETEAIRRSEWRVAPIPADLMDRRVEITGPVDRKMIINALNSGANVFMADFEDATSPTWGNLVEGQMNLRDAVAGTISYTDPRTKKTYQVVDRPATLMVRPRGWHLPEEHLHVDGSSIPGALFDFGIYFFHNVRRLLLRGTGPYFYLPKLQSHLEARLWNDVFVHAQKGLGAPIGTIRATVLLETLPAAFEMDEILYELRDHSAGLNCGRWDYIFSFIKTFREHPSYVLPDRGRVTMEQPFLRAYSLLVIRTCHRRGAHAIGGMAAQIPIKEDWEANWRALEKVRADKFREVTDGHDGTWVAHPGLVQLAREMFDLHMPGPNQIDRKRGDVRVGADDLLEVPRGSRTEAGLRTNVNVGIRYLEAWLRGGGCVPLDHLMEDAATAEISRTQVWQWIRHRALLDDGRPVTAEFLRRVVAEEFEKLAGRTDRIRGGRLAEAKRLFEDLVTAPTCADFFTTRAYPALVMHD